MVDQLARSAIRETRACQGGAEVKGDRSRRRARPSPKGRGKGCRTCVAKCDSWYAGGDMID